MNQKDTEDIAAIIRQATIKSRFTYISTVVIDALADYMAANAYGGCPGCTLCKWEGEPAEFDRGAWIKSCYEGN